MNVWSAWPWGTQRYQHFSNCCIIPVRIRSLTAMTIYPNHSVGDRSGLRRGESSPHQRGSFLLRLPCPLLTFSMWSEQIALPSAFFSRMRHPVAHGRPPGVNTCLSVCGCLVYGQSLKWIEDFTLCCRLVPLMHA